MPEDNPKRFKAVDRSSAKKTGHVSSETDQNDDEPKFKAARSVKRVDKKKLKLLAERTSPAPPKIALPRWRRRHANQPEAGLPKK